MIGTNATVSVYHLDSNTKTNTYPSTADLTGVEAYIESKSADLVQVLGEQSNIEAFDMFCDSIEIKVGDKIIDDRGREYRVTGVERHENNQDTDDLLRVTMHSKHQ